MVIRLMMLTSVCLVGCATSPSIEPHQQVSIEPYKKQVLEQCTRLRAPEKAGKPLSDETLAELCRSRTDHFARTTSAYLSLSLSEGALEGCTRATASETDACLIDYQKQFYEKLTRAMMTRLQSR